jgi:two-component system, NarL family, sensor histidine kinase EvgS
LWIKAHPVVTYTVLDHWPQAFVRNGVHRGLSREVLSEVETRTGIRFRYIPPDDPLSGPPMMVSAVNGNLLTAQQRASCLVFAGNPVKASPGFLDFAVPRW